MRKRDDDAQEKWCSTYKRMMIERKKYRVWVYDFELNTKKARPPHYDFENYLTAKLFCLFMCFNCQTYIGKIEKGNMIC